MRGTPCDLYGPPESYAEVARSEQTTSPLAGEGWDEGDSGGPRGPPESYAKSPSYDPGSIKEVKLLYPESTEGGRRVSVLKRQEGAPVNLG